MTDILDPDYESDLTEEEQDRLLLMCGHAVAPPLSPRAQAVLTAAKDAHWSTEAMCPNNAGVIAAAALRAVAEQLTFEDSLAGDVINPDELLAIAAELKAL